VWFFHSGDGLPINMDKVGRREIHRALEVTHLPWYGWHAFRRGLASNLYAMGAQDKVVQRLLRHSKPHVTRERYIKIFDRTLLDAVEKMQKRIDEIKRVKADRQQLELKFGDDFAAAKSSTYGGFSALVCAQASRWQAEYGRTYGKLLKSNRGEVAERLNAAVC